MSLAESMLQRRTTYSTASWVRMVCSETSIQPLLYRHLLVSAYLNYKLINPLTFPAKRLPYADHIISLDAEGRISEQGHFDELNIRGGYVSSFSLQPADWLYKPDAMVVPAPGGSITRAPKTRKNIAESSDDLEAEANRRTGDVSIYLYYIRSIGWPTTLVFIFCITAFVFCTSFPSKFSQHPYRAMLIPCSNLAQMVGDGGDGIPLRTDQLLPRYLRYAWMSRDYLPNC